MDNTEVLNTLLSNARTALNEFESYTQEQIDALIRRVCLDFKAHAEELAREAVEETGMGNVESKIAKNRGAKKARCTPCRSSMTLSPRWALPRTLSSASRNPPSS